MYKVIKAHVEQILEFPNRKEFDIYVQKMNAKPGGFEVEWFTDNGAEVTCKVKKQYNNVPM